MFWCLQKNYDYEVEAFKNHLEKVYKLCSQCEVRVKQELEQQDESIAKRLSDIDESVRSFMQPDSAANGYSFLVR